MTTGQQLTADDSHCNAICSSKIKRKATKSVHFADDHGYLLVKNFNIPTKKTMTSRTHAQHQQQQRQQHQQPPVKLSKVTNIIECTKDNNLIYLESTITNKSAVFGTLVVNDSINASDIKIAYRWDSKSNYRVSLPYYLGSRLLFKLPVPKRMKSSAVVTDENCDNTREVKFYVIYQEKKFININGGQELCVSWTES